MRSLAESNRPTRFCRPLPNLSAKRPVSHFMLMTLGGFSRSIGTNLPARRPFEGAQS